MTDYNGLLKKVINIDENQFEAVALELFRYQSKHNKVYKSFIHNLGLDPASILSIGDIPFLPIELFKSQKIVSGNWDPEMVFTSSGTGTAIPSKHYMRKLAHYDQVSERIFRAFYGPPDRYHILALLPSYLERSGSSLVHMLNHLISVSNSEFSGFYLHDYHQLIGHIKKIRSLGDRQIMLWGVSFALLDLAEIGEVELPGELIIETGGMKGRREEPTREDLHKRLCSSFRSTEIQSEYGMAELTSQAYTVDGRFRPPAWMKVRVRDISDPFEYQTPGKVGAINIIDLANLHSCSFIETQDLGEVEVDGSFTVLGRLDNSDVRGCNLLLE